MTLNGSNVTVAHEGNTYTAENGILTINNCGGNMIFPGVFAITNNGTEEATYTVSFAYPLGDMGNPEEILLGYNETKLPESSYGYYYTWTATTNGTLTFEITSITDGVIGDVVITNFANYAQRSLTNDGVVNAFDCKVVSMPVSEGDEISIQVVVVPDETTWEIPAADITTYSAFTATPGSEENPNMLLDLENTVTNAGTTYYQGYFNGMTMTVTGQTGFSVIYNGETVADTDGVVALDVASDNPRMPVIFAIVGDGEYAVNFTYPVGSWSNPEDLEAGYNEVSLPENSNGYCYTWTAPYDGVLTFEILSITEGVLGDISLYNENSWEYKTLSENAEEDEYGATVVNMPVSEGDVVSIQVYVLPDESWSYPAADIATWSAFTATPGSEANPNMIFDLENTIANEGSTYYQCYFSGMIMTVKGEPGFSVIYNGKTITAANGTIKLNVSSEYPRMPVVFAIVGDGEYSVDFVYPVGAMENPAELTLGYNDVRVAENSMGYFYKWTATASGTLTFRISGITNGVEGDIILNNNVTYVNRTLTEDGVEAYGTVTVSIDVNEGDEISIQIVSLPDMYWNYPAAVITTYSAFVPAPVVE